MRLVCKDLEECMEHIIQYARDGDIGAVGTCWTLAEDQRAQTKGKINSVPS